MTPYIDIQHLSKRFGDLELFTDISFSISEGQHVGLIARNGSGKAHCSTSSADWRITKRDKS